MLSLVGLGRGVRGERNRMRDNGGELEFIEGVGTCWTPDWELQRRKDAKEALDGLAYLIDLDAELDAAASKPEQMCTRCGIGPFFYVAGRERPTLCLDCAELA